MMARKRTPLVLVVDDDQVTVAVIRRVLMQAGLEVASASSAADAWRGIRERRPDLVLLDVDLPDGSGLDVCRRLQAEPVESTPPVLFISASDDSRSRVDGFKAGGVDYITKPLEAAEVVARVSTHLRLRQAYDALAELQATRIQGLAGAQELLMPLPADLPEARFEVSLKQVLRAGGDFYDVIPIGNGVFDYVVADASGHDLAASFWTAALKTLLGEYALAAIPPGTIVQSINHSLTRMLPPGVFFTLVYARLNRRTGVLSLVSAGHPPPIVNDRAANTSVVLRQQGDVLGAFPDASFGTAEVTLQRGDRLYFFSDGLIETGGDQDSGLEKVSAACRAGRESTLDAAVRGVMEKVVNGTPASDDVLLMGVEA